ncbi:hypothetical protein AB0B78_24965 [Streptomyces sp. NPDC040724]|uniref:hypothetical protein n=1 Tax=Streptomyces sp. NPDC040724 TaxID=3155612 RepID=UPI0033DAA39E
MNFIGEDFGRDPMTGFMTALAISPKVATEFFNTTQPTGNAQYVLGDRQTFDDTPLNSKDGNSAREATGAALVSAATGVNPNDPISPKENLLRAGATVGFLRHYDRNRAESTANPAVGVSGAQTSACRRRPVTLAGAPPSRFGPRRRRAASGCGLRPCP